MRRLKVKKPSLFSIEPSKRRNNLGKSRKKDKIKDKNQKVKKQEAIMIIIKTNNWPKEKKITLINQIDIWKN